MFNDRCPMFYKLLRESFRALMAQNSGYTGRIIVTVHAVNGVPELVAVDAPDRAGKWDERVK
jgi:hypothetical protein